MDLEASHVEAALVPAPGATGTVISARRPLPDSGLDNQAPRAAAFLRLFPFVMLAIALLTYDLIEHPSSSSLLIASGLVALAAAWVGWWVTLHPGWVERRGLMGIYFAGFVVIGAALTALSGWFGLFTWMGMGTAQRFLAGRWRYPGVVVAAAVVSAAQHPFQHPIDRWVTACLILTCVNTAIASLVGTFLRQTEDQNMARKGMIAELAEANGRLEEMVAENAGLHAQLLTQAREAGVLEERQRMAREIHDTLAQGLTGIVTQLEAAELAHSGTEWGRRLDNAKRLARDSLAEARRSVRAIQPEPLDNAVLPDAIAEVAERWSAVNGVATDVTTTGDARPLHPEVEVTLLRVAQEALSNVAKHAAASRVGLTLSYMEDVVTLDVRDDGTGFPGAGADGSRPTIGDAVGTGIGGFGLTAMRQRVSRLAGRLEIESEPGGGTAISASVPAIPRTGPGGAAIVPSMRGGFG